MSKILSFKPPKNEPIYWINDQPYRLIQRQIVEDRLIVLSIELLPIKIKEAEKNE